MTADERKRLRELAEWKLRVHQDPQTIFTGERANAGMAWLRAAHPQAVLALLDELDRLRALCNEACDSALQFAAHLRDVHGLHGGDPQYRDRIAAIRSEVNRG